MTTQQLAEAYGTETNNIHVNYTNNKDRFQEGRDYYLLQGESLKLFKQSLPNGIGELLKFAPILMLWTDRGANRHSKILDTDRAWEQFDRLEETYFKVKTGQYIQEQRIILPDPGQIKFIKQERFGSVVCDIYSDGAEIWLKRSNIGAAIGYKSPTGSIKHIVNLFPEKIQPFTCKIKTRPTDNLGGIRLYSPPGVKLICEYCQYNYKNALPFYSWVLAIRENLLPQVQAAATATPLQAAAAQTAARSLPDALAHNISIAKTFAELTGIDESKFLLAAIAETEQQTGLDLSRFAGVINEQHIQSVRQRHGGDEIGNFYRKHPA